jgi:hypothetical protein
MSLTKPPLIKQRSWKWGLESVITYGRTKSFPSIAFNVQ